MNITNGTNHGTTINDVTCNESGSTTDTSNEVTEDPTTTSDVEEDAVDAGVPSIAIPAFCNEKFLGVDKSKDMAADLAKRDWLPEALKREVMHHCYK